MKTIYTAILAQLQQEVPELKWIDLELGQLDTPERPPVAFPCALIEIGLQAKRNLTDTTQEGQANIGVRLTFDTPMQTAAHSKAREKSLQVYELINKVYKALQGFETEHFSALTRIRQQKEKSRHGLFQYRIDFFCLFEEGVPNN